MFQYARIVLNVVCLLTMTAWSKGQAQGKCTECPALSSTTTVVCHDNNCSVVASGCELVAKNISGSPKISESNSAKSFTITKTTNRKEISTCTYNIEGGKRITFSVK